ncbi:MAG: thioredoxin [Flavobacteriia bacterium]|nr:thioredoxin [Flavobacteriia bacterium]
MQSYSDWMHVQRQAQTHGLPVLVFFCGPEGKLCEEAKKQLEEEAIQNFTEARFIRTKAFLDDGPGGSLADHWAIDFIPALLILDDKGRAVGRWMGRSSSPELLAFIKESRKRATQYDGLKFREEIRLLADDTLRLRQTVGFDENTGVPTLVGQYYETRINPNV